MKQKKMTSMLLLPCAVIAAVIGLMVYFACSADDEFETNYEMETLASPQLRLVSDIYPDRVTYTKTFSDVQMVFIHNSSNLTDTLDTIDTNITLTVEAQKPVEDFYIKSVSQPIPGRTMSAQLMGIVQNTDYIIARNVRFKCMITVYNNTIHDSVSYTALADRTVRIYKK